jgi:hypothetical protein
MPRRNSDLSSLIVKIKFAVKRGVGFEFTLSNGLKGTLYRADQKQVNDIAKLCQEKYLFHSEATSFKASLREYWVIHVSIQGEDVYLLFYSTGTPYWYVNLAKTDLKKALNLCGRILYQSDNALTLCWFSDSCWPVLKGAILKKIQPSIYILLYKQKGR